MVVLCQIEGVRRPRTVGEVDLEEFGGVAQWERSTCLQGRDIASWEGLPGLYPRAPFPNYWLYEFGAGPFHDHIQMVIPYFRIGFSYDSLGSITRTSEPFALPKTIESTT